MDHRSRTTDMSAAATDHHAAIVISDAPVTPAISGPLSGLRVAVKDNIDVAGTRTTAGSALLASGPLAHHDAAVVAALRNAGAEIVVKVNMHELALGATGANPTFGQVRNPVDPERIAGGSSSGTAAAVAAGVTEAGLGTDTGGSVRVPAALTGLVGYRPTTGRYDPRGVVPLAPSRDTVGPITHSVAQAVAIDAVLSSRRSVDPIAPDPHRRLRLGVPRTFFVDDLDAATASAWQQALASLDRAGHVLVDVDADGLDVTESDTGRLVTFYEARQHLLPFLRATGLSDQQVAEGIRSLDVRRMFEQFIVDEAPQIITAAEYQDALSRCAKARKAYARVFDRHEIDALAFPTSPCVAAPVAAVGVDDDVFATYIRNTVPGSLAGVPGITLPIQTSDLPVGLSLDGQPHGDDQLLGVAATIEAILTERRS